MRGCLSWRCKYDAVWGGGMVSGGRERPGGMILCCAVEKRQICASKSSISASHVAYTSPNFASIEMTVD